jgi:glycosyltransferase involved in cell wall biosynthesis
MKINIVIPQSLTSPTAMIGGLPIARHLARRGNDVTLILLHHNIESATQKEIEIEPNVRAVYAGQMFVKKIGSRKIHFSPWALLNVAARSTTGLVAELLKRRADVNVIYKAQPPTVFAGLAVRAIRRVPTVLMVDDLESESNNLELPGLKSIFRAFERIGAMNCDAIIAHSMHLARHFSRLAEGTKRVLFIPPGVEPSRISTDEARSEILRERLDIEGKPVVLYFGSVDRASGHRVDLLIDAFTAVLRKVPAAVLVIAGAGEIDAMKDYARRSGVIKNVRFTGRFPLGDLAAYASLADVVVDPVDDSPANAAKCSSRVRFGMLFGRPVLTGDVGDRAWTLGEGGIAVRPPLSGAAFAQALYLMLVDREMRSKMGQKGRARILKNFTWGNVIDRYIDLFDSLARRRESAGRRIRRVPRVRVRRDGISV